MKVSQVCLGCIGADHRQDSICCRMTCVFPDGPEFSLACCGMIIPRLDMSDPLYTWHVSALCARSISGQLSQVVGDVAVLDSAGILKSVAHDRKREPRTPLGR